MKIKMSNVQGRLLLEESRYLLGEYHNRAYEVGSGRGTSITFWWDKGNGDNLQYFFNTSFIQYDFNIIYGEL